MAKVYVGTYNEYNSGNLHGAWLDLADYPTYQDFLNACHKVHQGEHDPEFMIQDSEDFPDGLDCMEWLSEQDFNDVKTAMQEQISAPASVSIIDYSERSFAVVGDTKPIKDQLKRMGGTFNKRLSCGPGWIFSHKRREAVEKFLASPEADNTPDGDDFRQWLDEFFAHAPAYYDKKNYVGAIKIRDRYALLERPHINTKFCFHDEGPDYEYYKSVIKTDDSLTAHFLRENLATFDNGIAHIEEGNSIWFTPGNYNSAFIQYHNFCDGEQYTPLTDDEQALVLRGLKYARQLLEKRLATYLKRWGTSKLHTWTYWADR